MTASGQLLQHSAPMGTVAAPPPLGYRLFDMEVHQGWRSSKGVVRYLPERYHQRFQRFGTGRSYIGFDQRGGGNRADTALVDGSAAASSPAAIAEQLLDRYHIEYVIGTGGTYGAAALPEADYAAALARAANDWLVHDWLPQDPRFLGALTIVPQEPDVAVEEIDRLGDHPRIVEIIMASGIPAPLGQRRYHPIYAAAERHRLPIATHTTTEGRGMNGPPTSAGYPSRYFEYHTNLWQSCAAHMASLLCEGVFAKFPGLIFVPLEGGVSWVLPLMWRLNQDWRLLRQEYPALSEPPSATIRRHFRFGTGHTTAGARVLPNFYFPYQGLNAGAAAAPAEGPAGSDPALVARDWLDRHGIARAVLSHEEARVISTWADTVYPTALATAYNDWLVGHWLSREPRFLGSMLVATQDPAAAAREIDRVGGHPQIVQVLLPSGTRLPYGAPYYHPIYAAAERLGLPIAIHTGTEGGATTNPPTAVGWPSTYLE